MWLQTSSFTGLDIASCVTQQLHHRHLHVDFPLGSAAGTGEFLVWRGGPTWHMLHWLPTSDISSGVACLPYENCWRSTAFEEASRFDARSKTAEHLNIKYRPAFDRTTRSFVVRLLS